MNSTLVQLSLICQLCIVMAHSHTHT